MTPWSGFSKLKRQIDEQIARQITEDRGEPMAPWTMHDLRRSLVTGMNDRGLAQPHAIEAIVNHISGHTPEATTAPFTWMSDGGRCRLGQSSSPVQQHGKAASSETATA